MHSVSFVASIRIECTRMWEECKRTAASLFGLFQKAVAHLTICHASIPLTDRKITVGGVENVGNSCIFSTMLQDFAAEPEFYDTLFTAPLQQGTEDRNRFARRTELQKLLYSCIQEVRSGRLVKRTEIKRLSHLLQKLGWEGHLVTSWRLFLHRIAPTLFPLPIFSPHTLYDTVLSLFAEASSSAHRIVLMAKDPNIPLQTFIEQSLSFRDTPHTVLWKIAIDNNVEQQLPQQFQLQGHQFTLKLVHVCQHNHVQVYRKHNESWICCNDAEITPVAAPPTRNVYSVVYESRP